MDDPTEDIDVIFDSSYHVLGFKRFFNADLRQRFVKVHSFVLETINKSRAEPKKAEWGTVRFDELPPWLKWNEYLLQGHRPPLPSLAACLKSWFHIHTETVNIWSHLLACITFMVILAHNFIWSDQDLREKLACCPYIIGFIICFGFSTAYHTVNCHSEAVSKAACTCDYLGILTCLLGSFQSAMFYLWWCRYHWTFAYCSVYSILAICCAKLILISPLSQRDGKATRAIIATVIACSGFIALFHDMTESGFWYVFYHYPMGRVALIFALCLTGAVLYSTRTPERIWPGKFDVWFHSHQLFHILVAAGALLGYHALISMADFRTTMTNSTICKDRVVISFVKYGEGHAHDLGINMYL